MTYREKIISLSGTSSSIIKPDGNMWGCPKAYIDNFTGLLYDDCNIYQSCEECWNQEYTEGSDLDWVIVESIKSSEKVADQYMKICYGGMTYKEKLIEITGDKSYKVIGDKFVGGVCGCPNDWFDIIPEIHLMCFDNYDIECTDCWNQEYKDEERRKDFECYFHGIGLI